MLVAVGWWLVAHGGCVVGGGCVGGTRVGWAVVARVLWHWRCGWHCGVVVWQCLLGLCLGASISFSMHPSFSKLY